MTRLRHIISGPLQYGETRQSILPEKMDARVKPAHDDKETYMPNRG
jgi:hypothetical protein